MLSGSSTCTTPISDASKNWAVQTRLYSSRPLLPKSPACLLRMRYVRFLENLHPLLRSLTYKGGFRTFSSS
jgi:hypothetical protein